MIGHQKQGNINNIARPILIILPSLSQSACNTRFYFGHQKPCMDNNKDSWFLVIEGVNTLLQLLRDLPPYVQTPSLFSFLLVPTLLVLISSSDTVYTCSMAMSRWAHTLKLFTNTATCSGLVEMPFMPPEPFPRLMYVCSPNWSAGTAFPPSECRQTCGPASRSSLAHWGRLSICRTYQLK